MHRTHRGRSPVPASPASPVAPWSSRSPAVVRGTASGTPTGTAVGTEGTRNGRSETDELPRPAPGRPIVEVSAPGTPPYRPPTPPRRSPPVRSRRDADDPGPGADEALRRRRPGRRPPRLRRSSRRGHGVPRAQRGREDHHPADAPRARQPDLGLRTHRRTRLPAPAESHHAGRGRPRGVGLPSRPYGAEPLEARRHRGRDPVRAGRRVPRPRRPLRRRRPQGRWFLDGDAPAPRAGPGVARASRHPRSRRAGQRPRPAGDRVAPRLPQVVRDGGSRRGSRRRGRRAGAGAGGS